MKKLLLLLTVSLTLSCCNKNDDDQPTNPIDQLPPATQTGANTFGFLVNGEPINVTNTSQQTAIYQGGVLQIGGGIDNSDMDIRVIIRASEVITQNTSYNLTNTPTNQSLYINNGNGCYYDYPSTLNGIITISNFDQTNFIISGTFDFSTATNSCDDISITNGRFDLQYIP
ncbi:DUF6252 family protein [Bizionia paragorgiae]|uniref:Lipoprotein n=1 Tax=Bizionia paragorgiae TaxID=283786 RepID=A0A1H4BLL6_BIZPA|nr:DUF6252 family protein [Bizionia paragorgiae]SEA48996.1 hypothetical protein SAMN04487990_11529 [Bizionia paragorgiae]